MTESEQNRSSPRGPASYANWRALTEGEPLLWECEYLIYSDAWLTGQVTTGLGPYAFFNLVPLVEQPGKVRAAAALRISFHGSADARTDSFEALKMGKSDASGYHGGTISDELAALASLRCGVRLRSGGVTRRFEVIGDPKGLPVAWSDRTEPTLSVGVRGVVMPTVTGEHSMMPVEGIKSLPTLSAEQANALVRAARLYQDALWLAESEPNLSWLMLVGAVEAPANLWRAATDTPLDRLRASRPEFMARLEAMKVEGLSELVAKEFAGSIGVARKSVDFLTTFLAPQPVRRPAEWAQLDWSIRNLKEAFRTIYHNRSRALHDGVPFPWPMCQRPERPQEWPEPAERPPFQAASALGGSWLARDTPMYLHVFEHIVRNALVAWWSSMDRSAYQDD